MGKNNRRFSKKSTKNPFENIIDYLIRCKYDLLNSSTVTAKEKELLGKLVRLTDGKLGYVFSVINAKQQWLYKCHICKTKNMNTHELIQHSVWPKHVKRLKMTVHYHHKFLLKEERSFTQSEEINEDLPDTNIQNYIDDFKEPLVGLEYLLEIIDKKKRCKYFCLLCSRMESLDSIFNHLSNSNHQLKFLVMFFPTAARLLKTIRNKSPFKPFISLCAHVSKSIEHVHGRLRPRQIQSKNFSHDNKEGILNQVDRSKHIRESNSQTFSECVDLMHLKPGKCPYVSELDSISHDPEDSHYMEDLDKGNDTLEMVEKKNKPYMHGSFKRDSQDVGDNRKNTDTLETFGGRDKPYILDSVKRLSQDLGGNRRNTETFGGRDKPYMQGSIRRESQNLGDNRRNTDTLETFGGRDKPYILDSMKRVSQDLGAKRIHTDTLETFGGRDKPYILGSMKRVSQDLGGNRINTDTLEMFGGRDKPYMKGSIRRESQNLGDNRRITDTLEMFGGRDKPYMQGSIKRDSQDLGDNRRNTDTLEMFGGRDKPYMQGSIKRDSQDLGDNRRNTDTLETFGGRDKPYMQGSIKKESQDLGENRRNTDTLEMFGGRDKPYMQGSIKRDSQDLGDNRRNTDTLETFGVRDKPYMQGAIKKESQDLGENRRNTETFGGRDKPYMQGSIKRDSQDLGDNRRNTDTLEMFGGKDKPYMQGSIRRESQNLGDNRRNTDTLEMFGGRGKSYMQGSIRRESQNLGDNRRNTDTLETFGGRDKPYMQGSIKKESQDLGENRRNTDTLETFGGRDKPYMQSSIRRESLDLGANRINTDTLEICERRDIRYKQGSITKDSHDIGDNRRNTVIGGNVEHTFSRYSDTPSTSRLLEDNRNERYHRDGREFHSKSSIWDEIHVTDSDKKIIINSDEASYERSYQHWDEVHRGFADQRNDDSYESIPNKGQQKLSEPQNERLYLDNSDSINMVSVLRDLTQLRRYIGVLGEEANHLLLQTQKFGRSIKSPNEEHCFFLSLVKQKLLECLGLGVLDPRLSSLAQNIIRQIIHLISDQGVKSSKIQQQNTGWSRHVAIVNKPSYSICEVPNFVRELESLSHLSYADQDSICSKVCSILNEEGKFQVYEDELFSLIKTALNSQLILPAERRNRNALRTNRPNVSDFPKYESMSRMMQHLHTRRN